jgi:beta-galactosidase
MHPRYRNWQTDSLPCDLAMVTDVQAYNYRYMYFPGDGKRFPWMTFYQSEAAVATMGPNFFEMDLDKVMGLAYWGAIDYLGESQGWPAKGWNQGVFDIALNPKPNAYLMKSIFMPNEPVVHIGIVERLGNQMWNGVQTGTDAMTDHWNREEGQRVGLITYTNADEVELLLNGKSLGTKQNPVSDPKQRNQIRWINITYAPGTLEAVARTNGKVVARHKIETTGPAVKLVAQSDNSEWRSDGLDLQHVRIAAVDKKGREVPTAQGLVTFSVEGPADIVGVINGDITSPELTVGNTRSLYNGSCSVILRSQTVSGKVTLKASAPGLKPVSIDFSL